ncbi:MAG TPA: DUF2252 domain-containing protein [Gaiellaceae bacterium]|nr:DUF2252 domain-containing protein [Gaiellaceae bacterium]
MTESESTPVTRSPKRPAAGSATTRTRRPSRAKALPHLTPAESTAKGRVERAEVGRSAQGEWSAPPDRRDPVDLLEEQAAARVPELIPIRYGRMLVSPFAFYRGAAYIMAADLAGLPRTGLLAQLCGDAHLSNFGIYAASDRRLVFSVNDFDETLPGPFEWDLKRLVASFAVAGRDRGFTAEQRRKINQTVTHAYRAAMKSFAGMDTLDEWYARLEVDQVADVLRRQGRKKQLKQLDSTTAKAHSRTSLKAFSKLTHLVDGEPRIASDPPTIVPVAELTQPGEKKTLDDFLHSLIRSYRQTLPGDRRVLLERFRYTDAARKVVGVGSVGTRAWIVLLLGSRGDPLFLQIKEAQASVLESFLGKSAFSSHGQRVVEGQLLTQATSDIMLGWLRETGVDGVERDFYVRQLWDSKGSADVTAMNPKGMETYAQACGWALAKAHARSGDAIAIAGYLGSSDVLDQALAEFAEAYADQNQKDYEALEAAVASGRVEAEKGV